MNKIMTFDSDFSFRRPESGKLIFMISIFLSYHTLAQNVENLVNVRPNVGIKYFYWSEYDMNGAQDLEEYGAVFSGGITGKFKFADSLDLYTITDIGTYYGLVNYNGYLQLSTGGTEDYKSETAYWGIEVLLNLGYDINFSNNFLLAPEAGIKFEYWNRDLDNGGIYGYDEIWQIYFIDFGCNFIFPLSQSANLFIKLFGEYPISISESVDLASRGQGGPSDINLNPGSNIGLNSEIGAEVSGIYLSIHINYLLFSSSVFDQGFHQPRSDRSLTGLKFGYTF